MGRMIGRLVAILLLWSLCGFGDLSTALAQTAHAVSNEGVAQPSASPSGSAQPASDTTAPAEPATANSDPSDKPSQSKLPDAPSAAQAPATTEIAQQSKPTEETPSGTAAATIGNPKGNLASKPAGAAIAPSQQHRSRSLLVKTGLVVGAAIALGSVVALSQAGSGRPPGAH